MMEVGAATHPGYVRSGNEDGFFASREHAVFAVADGMGGHDFGEVASHLALDVIERQAEKIAVAAPTDLPLLLHGAIEEANAAILSQAESQDAQLRMGTTIVLVTICGDRLYFAHIGDSRLYLLRGEAFSQLTRDHSLVQSMVDRGEITPEEAAIHPLRHQITRVVGGDAQVSPEIASQALEPGDMILLCTDGLSGAVSQDDMKAILGARQSAQEKADELVQAALHAGGPDNITVVVAAYHEALPVPVPESEKMPEKRPDSIWMSLLIVGIGLVIMLGIIGVWGYLHPRYYISSTGNGEVALFRRWPLLPMKQPEMLPAPETPTIIYEDARPFLIPTHGRMGSGHDEIVVENPEAGVAFLQNTARQVGAELCEEARSALEARNFVEADGLLERAVPYADPELVKQLRDQLEAAKKKPTVSNTGSPQVK